MSFTESVRLLRNYFGVSFVACLIWDFDRVCFVFCEIGDYLPSIVNLKDEEESEKECRRRLITVMVFCFYHRIGEAAARLNRRLGHSRVTPYQ